MNKKQLKIFNNHIEIWTDNTVNYLRNPYDYKEFIKYRELSYFNLKTLLKLNC